MIPIMRIIAAVSALLLLAGCGQRDDFEDTDAVVSDIERDEAVVFFNTSGWLDEANREWHLPVHGWIYEPETSVARRAAFEKVMQEKFELTVTDETEANFSRRLNLLIADNERGKTIVVNLAGNNYELPASVENGHFETTIVISADDAAKHAENGFVHYTAVTAENELRQFSGTVRLLGPEGHSIISDIDDTVKISRVGDHKGLLEQTFLLDFAAAPGMAELYRKWSTEETGFHYVSSSPWQLYEPLDEFLEQDGFPWATFSLKSVRFRDETLIDLFKEGTETKPVAITKILDRYPNRKFVLVGDSGEQDPEVYAAMMRNRPDQVVKAYIRDVTDESADNDRFTQVFADIDPERWQLFDDPESLSAPGDR